MATLIDKVTSGKLDKLETKDGIEIAETVAGFSSSGIVQAATLPLAGIRGAYEGAEEEDRTRKTLGLGKGPLSRPIKEAMTRFRNRWSSRMKEAATAAGGAIAGAALGTALFPGLGTIGGFLIGGAGSVAGGYVADKVYNKFDPRPSERDAVTLAVEMTEAQNHGEPIPAQLVFVNLVLAAKKEHMSAGAKREVAKVIEAWDKGNMDKLNDLMQNNQHLDDLIDTYSGMDCIPDSGTKVCVAQRCADLINKKQMKPKELLYPTFVVEVDKRLRKSLSAHYAATPTPPVTPHNKSRTTQVGQD